MTNFATAASAMKVCQDQIDVATHTIASLNNPGFKEEMAIASSMQYTQNIAVGSLADANGTIIPAGVQIGHGAKTTAVVSKHTQGPMVQTGRPYDVGITGRGYFVVELANGETAYTRDGTFTLSADRTLVTQKGGIVSPSITIPTDATNVVINSAGQVSAEVAGAIQDLGTLEIALFNNDDGLRKGEDNLSFETDASGTATVVTAGVQGAGTLMQGSYEASNVDAVTAVTNLVMIQRVFEMAVKAHKTGEEMAAKQDRIGA